MRYVASYLLAALGGNASPSAKDIKKILDSVGIEADDDRLNKVARGPGVSEVPGGAPAERAQSAKACMKRSRAAWRCGAPGGGAVRLSPRAAPV